MKAVNIEWCTDDDNIILPEEMELPDNIEYGDWNAVNEYLSDATGYLVNGYDIEK